MVAARRGPPSLRGKKRPSPSTRRDAMSPQKGVSGKPSSASPGGSSPGGSSPGGSSPGGSSGSGRVDSIRLAVSFADVVASVSKLGSLLQVEVIDLERGLGRGGIRGNPSVKRLQGIAQGLAFVG